MKKALTLIIILAVLLLVYWMVESDKPVVSTEEHFIKADSASITKLEVQSEKGQTALLRQSDGWVIEGEKLYPVNERMLGAVLKKFDEMTKKALISERPEKFADMEVGDSLGVKVTVYEGDKSTTLILGKVGPTFRTSYARLDGSNEIWEVAGNHRSTFDKNPEDWRDKTINKYELADFNKYVLTYPDYNFTMVKQDTLWDIDDGKQKYEGDMKLVERLSRMMSRVNAVEFVDTLAADFFDEPDFHIVADLVNGEKVDIKLKQFGEDKYYLHKDGAISDYVIYKATADAMMKKPEDFVKKDEDKAQK